VRIEISNYAETWSIDTRDPRVAAGWLKSLLREMISVNISAPPWQIRVYPRDDTERSYIGNPGNLFLDADGMDVLADVFAESAQKIRRRNNRVLAPHNGS
jgi:hypothetical protein